MGTRINSPFSRAWEVGERLGAGKHLVQCCTNYGASVYKLAEVLRGWTMPGWGHGFSVEWKVSWEQRFFGPVLTGECRADATAEWPLQANTTNDSRDVMPSDKQQVGAGVPDSPPSFWELLKWSQILHLSVENTETGSLADWQADQGWPLLPKGGT